jgi:hypothetical protein
LVRAENQASFKSLDSRGKGGLLADSRTQGIAYLWLCTPDFAKPSLGRGWRLGWGIIQATVGWLAVVPGVIKLQVGLASWENHNLATITPPDHPATLKALFCQRNRLIRPCDRTTQAIDSFLP